MNKITIYNIGLYSRLNGEVNKNIYNLYLYENNYIGNITKKEDIEENEIIKVYRDRELVMEYIKEIFNRGEL